MREGKARLLWERERLRREEGRLLKEKLAAYERYGAGKLSREEYEKLRMGLERRGSGLKERLSQQEERLERVEDLERAVCGLREAEDTATDIAPDTAQENAGVWDKIPFSDQASAEIFIKRITISEPDGIKITWNFCGP